MSDSVSAGQTAPDRREVRLVVASSVVGTTVEWYDFFLYGTAAGIIFNRFYFPSDDPLVGTLLAFATFALGFVARPVGGLIFGHIGDRIGRKKTLVATMLIMGVATCAIGLIPTYDSIGTAAPILLVLMRLAQGVAIGGEWGGAVLMSVEYAPKGRRGLYGSFPQLGLALGLVLGTGVFAGLGAMMDEAAFLSWGWRIAFLLSAVLVIAGMVIRLKVMETPAFRQLEQTEAKATVPALELVRNKLSRRHVLLGMGSRWIEGVAFNTWAVFSISFGAGTLEMPQQTLLISVMIAALMMVVFIPLFGRLSDTVGRRALFGWGALIAGVVAYPALALLGTGTPVLAGVGLVLALGVLYPMMYGPQAAFYSEMFPVNVRCTGISFVYQFSGIFASGLTPLVLSYLVGLDNDGYSLVAIYLVVAAVISAVCTFAVRKQDLLRIAEAEQSDLDARAATTPTSA
ncbi:MFS transporter [Prauserella cavernicola]|uniref:Putative proline/betaine transporter n=1 Tax=Prauserella cavernicola TaxID=2800127 RepID=A0A934V8C9_9PSEU|nr:MFS transporter [Prauserella cavernicola]MBK1787618.1 MHS family MFS transporter [Prauserella cavernicola]